jgi:hypothetical protein
MDRNIFTTTMMSIFVDECGFLPIAAISSRVNRIVSWCLMNIFISKTYVKSRSQRQSANISSIYEEGRKKILVTRIIRRGQPDGAIFSPEYVALLSRRDLRGIDLELQKEELRFRRKIYRVTSQCRRGIPLSPCGDGFIRWKGCWKSLI